MTPTEIATEAAQAASALMPKRRQQPSVRAATLLFSDYLLGETLVDLHGTIHSDGEIEVTDLSFAGDYRSMRDFVPASLYEQLSNWINDQPRERLHPWKDRARLYHPLAA